MIEIRVLGRLQIISDGEEVEVRSPMLRELICFLAVNYRNGVHADQLVDTIWPEADQAKARRRLSQSIWRLTSRMPGFEIERSRAGWINLVVGNNLSLDLDEFDRQFDWASQTLNPTVVGKTLADFQNIAISEDATWLAAERQGRLRACADLRQRTVDALVSQGELESAVALVEAWLLHGPFDDQAMQQLLDIHLTLGTYAEGIDRYNEFSSKLRDHLDIEPEQATVELASQLITHKLLSAQPPDTADLIGRATPLRLLSEALADASKTSRGHAFTIVGEPGIGKTALAETAATTARSLGMTVLFVEHSLRSVDLPYGGLKWVLAHSVRSKTGRRCLEGVDKRWLSAAANVLPDLAGSSQQVDPVALKPAEEVWRQREAVAQVVLGFARDRPTVVVLDDAQWADTETLAVFERLHHSIGDLPLVLVQSTRPAVESRRPMSDSTPSTLVELEGLDSDSASALAEQAAPRKLSSSQLSQIVQAARGNPFFVVELSKHADKNLLSAGLLQPTAAISQLIRSQTDLMSSATRQVAEVLAVVQVSLARPAIAAMTRLSPESVIDAVSELVQMAIAEKTSSGFRLRHDLFRSAIESDLDESTRVELHRRAVSVLADLELAPAPTCWHEIAAHAKLGGDPQSEFVARMHAAESAEHENSPELAVQHLRRALNLDSAETGISQPDIAIALLRFDTQLSVLGKHEERLGVLTRCEALTSSPVDRQDPSLRLSLLRRRVDALTQQSKFSEALKVLRGLSLDDRQTLGDERQFMEGRALHLAGRSEEAIPLLREPASSRQRRNDLEIDRLMTLGSALWSAQRFQEARETLRRALHLCETSQASRQLVDAVGHLATLEGSQGRVDEASALHARATSVASRIGYRRGEAINLVNLATSLAMSARGGASMRLYDKAEAVFRSIDDKRGMAFVRLNRGEARLWLLADPDGAEADAEAASSFFGSVSDRRHLSSTVDLLANVSRVRNQMARAATLGAEGLRLARHSDDGFLEVQALRTCARVALEQDECEQALAQAQAAIEICDTHGFSQLVPFLITTAASAQQRLGDTQACGMLLDDLDRFDLTTASLRHEVMFAAAQIAEATGRTDAALEFASESIRFLSESLEGLSIGPACDPPNLAAMRKWFHARTGTVVSSTVPAAPGSASKGFSGSVTVEWHIEEPSDAAITDPIQRRREQLRRLCFQADREGAAPRRSDLATLLNVSEATIKRDLKALRAEQPVIERTA